jgi:hypothetical protein
VRGQEGRWRAGWLILKSSVAVSAVFALDATTRTSPFVSVKPEGVRCPQGLWCTQRW